MAHGALFAILLNMVLTKNKQIKLQTHHALLSGQLITSELIEADMGHLEFSVSIFPYSCHKRHYQLGN